MPLLETLGIINRRHAIPAIDQFYFDWWDLELTRLQRIHRFEAVVVEYVFFSKALHCFDDSVHKVVDTHDIFSGRDEAISAAQANTLPWLSTDKESEGSALNRADTVLGIQHEETSLLKTMTARPVVTVGYFIDTNPGRAAPQPKAPAKLLFVGTANVLNVAACEWFVDAVLSLILRTVTDAHFRIVGGVGRALPAALRQHRAVEIAGCVEDLAAEYAAATVVINPVRFGTGLAIKSIEALAHSTPLVCTTAGSRGLVLAAAGPRPCIMADEPDAFAAGVVSLLSDPCAWKKCASDGLRFIDLWNAEHARNLTAVFSRHPRARARHLYSRVKHPRPS